MSAAAVNACKLAVPALQFAASFNRCHEDHDALRAVLAVVQADEGHCTCDVFFPPISTIHGMGRRCMTCGKLGKNT